jgi:hypothetical protein
MFPKNQIHITLFPNPMLCLFLFRDSFSPNPRSTPSVSISILLMVYCFMIKSYSDIDCLSSNIIFFLIPELHHHIPIGAFKFRPNLFSCLFPQMFSELKLYVKSYFLVYSPTSNADIGDALMMNG